MKTRTEIINELISKNKYQSYLEIGEGDSRNFDSISCLFKSGVDPTIPYPYKLRNSYYNMDSDFFFLNIHKQYDLIFIDGLHHAEQVEKDIVNGWSSLTANGMLLLHDCNPSTEEMQAVPRKQLEWTGDVWRACIGFRSVYGNLIKTSLFNERYGIFAIYKSDNEIQRGFIDWLISYDEFALNKHKYLGDFENL